LSALPDPTNLRQFRRISIDAEVRLYSDRAMWTTRMVDISLHGALLAKPDGWTGQVGKTQRLELRMHTSLIISVNATIANVGNPGIGYRFERMDLDSFARLKRLIELNTGEPELLHRELSALAP
jgi:hypothetical protein